MTKSQIFTLAHEQRRTRGINMSLALRQAYALRRTLGFEFGRGESTDLGGWLSRMATKGALAEYGIPMI